MKMTEEHSAENQCVVCVFEANGGLNRTDDIKKTDRCFFC